MDNKELIKKKTEIIGLLFEVGNNEVDLFFDLESNKMLDEKIEVLNALKQGKTISEIPNFYDVLELYPQDNAKWD